MKRSSAGIVRLILITLLAASCTATKNDKIIFVCKRDNDLYRAVVQSVGKYRRYESAREAVERASDGSGILVLADNYPNGKVALADDIFNLTKNKQLKLYIEYPGKLPGITVGDIQKTEWQRGVVTSDVFGEALKKMRIVMLHDAHYIDMEADDPYLVLAKVAGFDTAVYGLDSTDTHPILFELQETGILVSTTKLSQFITARYAPKDAWESIWAFIFRWLQPDGPPPELDWTETVHPAFRKDEVVPETKRSQAIQAGIDWFYNSKLLNITSRNENEAALATEAIRTADYGTNGIYECFLSKINYDGSQKISRSRRADCASETAMSLALHSFFAGNQQDKTTAENLQDFIYFNSRLQGGPRGQPDSASFGFIDWFVRPDDNNGVYYSDDNARVILGTLVSAAALMTDRWNDGVVKAVLANFRATGPAGFKPRRLEEMNLQRFGWQHYRDDNYHHFAPHYQSWIWATYLWLYDKTGYEPLLKLTKTGISNMMRAYPDEWHWTNGLQQERARMILALAWLLRVQDNPQHKTWLYQVVDDLLSFQDASGAIREDLGNVGHGKYAPPKTNAAYGTNEAPLIQANGDPVADMLYTSNFAFFSLREAASVTGDAKIRDAVDRLADFMVRIQARSETRPELNGVWFRAFDFQRWEYWGSNADLGWGVWSTETGWTQGWITTMLMMQEMDTNVWDFTANIEISNAFGKYKDMMLIED